jgi:hypothetical protein
MVKEEASPEVYVAGLRTYESDSLDKAPRQGEEPTYIRKLWVFLEKLVGSDSSLNNKIIKIDIFYNGRGSECDCGAIISKEGASVDTEERLREPCSCRGAQGIVVFEEPKAAKVLRNVIKEHKKLHWDGHLTEHKVRADQSIHFCEVCCLDNKKIKCTTVRPVASDEPSSGEDTEEECTGDLDELSEPPENIITEEQLSAANIVLSGALGPLLTLQISTLIVGTKGADVRGAYASIVRGVRDIFESTVNKDLLPTKFTHAEYKSAVSDALSHVLTNVKASESVNKAVEWTTMFAASTDGKVKIQEEVIVDEPGKTMSELNDSSVMNEEEVPSSEANEEELAKEYKGIESLLTVCKGMDIEAMGEITAAEDTLKALRKANAKVVSIYVKLEATVKSRLQEEHTTISDKLSEAIKKLQYQISHFKLTKGESVPRTESEKVKSSTKTEQDLPTKTEINQDIKKFEASVSVLDHSLQDIEDIINDEEVEENKNEFNTIHSRIKPDIKDAMSTMAELVKGFKKWLRVTGEKGMTKDVKKALQEKVKDEAKYYAQVQEINLRISKIDRKFNHGIKSYEATGLGSLLNQEKVELFYGEEYVQGKKWQNLFEWLKRIEMKVCRHINDKPSQLYEVMSYLSPNIKKIASAHRPAFKSYNELKVWLIENHVNMTRIVTELQNRIASVVPTKHKDVEGFIIHTRGILAMIEEHCESYPKIRPVLLSEKNLAALIKFIFGQIGKVTGHNEMRQFLKETWNPFKREMKEKEIPITQEQQLRKMEEHLELIIEEINGQVYYDEEAIANPLSGPGGGAERGYNRGRGSYRSRGGRRGGAGNFSSRRKGRGTWSSSERKDATSSSVNYCLVSVCSSKEYNGNTRILTTDASEGAQLQNSKSKSSKAVFVQVTDDDLIKARTWEKNRSKLTLACWMCTSTKPHELWNCPEFKTTTSGERFKKARDREFGPGTQCFSCLSGSCFITRALDAAKNFKNSEQNDLKPCENYKRWNMANEIACVGCVEDANKSPDGLVKKQKPMNALICPKKSHCEGSIKSDNARKINKKYGHKYAPQLRIQCVMLVGYDGERQSEVQSNKVDGIGSGLFKNVNNKKKSPPKRQEPPEISEKEYKGSDASKLLDTTNGNSTYLDMQKKEIAKTLIKASKGLPLYFMQEFNLDGNRVLCFYDSGAMFNLMKTAIARKLKLKMTSRKPMWVVGAGEHVHSTGDGKYELVLGEGKHGERYLLEVAGSEELTGFMLEADFRQSHDEVRDHAKRYADNGQKIMEEDEKLPLCVGGMKAGIIIGLSTPTLQPKILMCLPSGMLVAESKLKDTNGANIVFGGMFDNYKRFFQSNYIGDPESTPGLYKMTCAQVDEYTMRHQVCWEEYCNYRDSLRIDMVYFSNGKEVNQKWKSVIDKENDAMTEEAPIIIAGSEEKRGEQLYQQEVMKRLINSGGKVIYQTKVHEEIEPIQQLQVYPKREKLIEEETRARALEKSMNKPRRQAIKGQMENNILLNKLEKVDALRTKVDELVNERFNIKTEQISSNEGVYFQAEVDKINYYESIEDGPELEELLLKNTDIQITADEKCNLETKGLAAFRKTANSDLWTEEDVTTEGMDCKIDHGCLCSTGDLDLIFNDIAEGLVNSDKKEWLKLKKAIRKWEDDETIGTGVDYRCSKCVNCKDCLNSGRSRARSQREEDEQRVIESSVRIDWINKKCHVFLPWIKSPQELALRWGSNSNLKQANHFLRKMLAKSAEDRASLTRFWEELKKRDVVAKLKDLSEDLQKQIMGSAIKHFYPWNCVFKDSITTPCRMVVDSRTSGLNDHLAKGLNTLNNLQQLLIKFRGYKHIGSYDISKMYNMLYIEEAHLQYQLILWVDEMNPENEVEVWVMLRAIYGTVSSGNQAEVAIRRGATELKEDYP